MDPSLRGIADYLLTKVDAASVDPAQIDPQSLPYMFILDVERGLPLRLRIRLVGNALDLVFQRPLVGGCLRTSSTVRAEAM